MWRKRLFHIRPLCRPEFARLFASTLCAPQQISVRLLTMDSDDEQMLAAEEEKIRRGMWRLRKSPSLLLAWPGLVRGGPTMSDANTTLLPTCAT